MIDQIISARARRIGDVFGHLRDADRVAVNRPLAVFVGITA